MSTCKYGKGATSVAPFFFAQICLLLIPLGKFRFGIVVVQYLRIAISLGTHHGCTDLA